MIFRILKKLKLYISGIFMDAMQILDITDDQSFQRSSEFLEWLNSDLVKITGQFIEEYKLLDSPYMKQIVSSFNTNRFELYLHRWVVEYYLRLFRHLDLNSNYGNNGRSVFLEKNPLNQYGVEKYYDRFKSLPQIKWKKQSNIAKRILLIALNDLKILYSSLRNGWILKIKKKSFVVMREALWSLYDCGGYYFHDDFFVDGIMIKEKDLLLFSRGLPSEGYRLKGYYDARRSNYEHFVLGSLPIDISSFLNRIIFKYIFSGNNALFSVLGSNDFSLFFNIYLFFCRLAVPYEQIFSNYKVVSELGHNYHDASHIPESIVCQNHGTKYYVMHWSDLSTKIASNLLSYLGCDKFLLWGKVHALQELKVGNDPNILAPIGYAFKRFIKIVQKSREKILKEMKINNNGKVISFFDESFGGLVKMSGREFVSFWEMILKISEKEPDYVVLIKSKGHNRRKSLTDQLLKRYLEIRDKLENMSNVNIVDEKKWSFIECVGVADVVITQGMTSSATIAIISGINGLYYDQAKYDHPFSDLFKDKLVFDDSDKLLEMIRKIVRGEENPLEDIPENIIESYNAYNDDAGIDRLREILSQK